MVEAYNYYAGGFIPKVNPKTNVHNRRELKSKYKSIVALNNANPLAMISLSKDTSDYALDVKSMSMELGEAASLALDSDQQGEALETTLQLYNKLLSRSDEYGNLKNKPSRPGCELRKLVEECADELTSTGIAVDESGFLSRKVEEMDTVPKDFLQKYRVTRARELLVLTELSVESIGKSCGYGNAERFARAFKHETGLTPTQFRRQDRSKNRRNLEVSEDGLEKLINS